MKTINTPTRIPGDIELNIDTIDCKNTTPVISFDGKLQLSGLKLKIIFKNNVKGTHELEVVKNVDIDILEPGEPIVFNKQPSLDGVGGNPHISVQLTDSAGNPVSREVELGRCVQLSK